jgi:hypothetical protein
MVKEVDRETLKRSWPSYPTPPSERALEEMMLAAVLGTLIVVDESQIVLWTGVGCMQVL